MTTADDLAKWLIMQNSAGEAANGTRLISAAGHEGHARGTRVERRGEGAARMVQHGGWLFTFTAHEPLLPTGHGFA